MFKKYPEINNSYHKKNLSFWLSIYPELKNERFAAEGKLDGSNVSFLFQPNKPFEIYSRERPIVPSENFFDVWNVIKEEIYQEFFVAVQREVEHANFDSIQVTGELFGKGIQKRINYGDKKYIKFFSVRINDILQTPEFCYDFIPDNLLIHVENDNLTLEEALNFNVENLKDFFSVNGESKAEGIVIKPLSKVYISPLDEIFYLKKKNENFAEKYKVKEDVQKFSDSVIKLNVIFQSYLTKNRMLGIFSKHGENKEQNQLGEYIKLLREDAIKDFMKENEEEFNALDKKEQKAVFNVGNTIAKMFQKQL